MSWQEYVDNNLMCPLDSESRTLVSAALVGLEGSVWAKSSNFPDFTQAEVGCAFHLYCISRWGFCRRSGLHLRAGSPTAQIEAVKNIMAGNNPGAFTIGGAKYFVLMSDDPETKLRGKINQGGCSISKTGKTLVVGIWADPITAGQCNKVVEVSKCHKSTLLVQ